MKEYSVENMNHKIKNTVTFNIRGLNRKAKQFEAKQLQTFIFSCQ